MNLIGTPKILASESPASWLSRAALSQGVSITEFLKFIDLDRKTDIDLAFTRRYVRYVASVTNQEVGDFKFVQHMMTSLRFVDRHGEEYLLGHKRAARYRFCPVCLVEARIKTFPLEWRFKAWRWCPLHQCMMLDQCPHCRAVPLFPADMLKGGPKRSGIASLDRCMSCGEHLGEGWQSARNSFDFSLTTPWEAALMDNGRAVLAALACRRVRIEGDKGVFSLRGLKRMQRRGLLPHDHFKLIPEEVDRRRQVQLLLIHRQQPEAQ